MDSKKMAAQAAAYLHYFCNDLPTRRVGSAGNRAAADFFAEPIAGFGFATERPAFDCIDWREDGAELEIGTAVWHPAVSPYSNGGAARGPLTVVQTVAELEQAAISGSILLLLGEIAGEQIMPKHFPFYNPDHHRHIVQLLESKQPAAIIAATTQDPGLAGAVSPFPLFEDGDFDIPSVYLTAAQGAELAALAGREAALTIRAERQPAVGWNVVARRGDGRHGRLVFFAHIDAKDGTPGAIDNGTGVTILLLLAELLAEYAGSPAVEIVALNGEDYYDASGEKLYLRENEGAWDDIVLGINLDGVGYHQGRTAYSLYDCPPALSALVQDTFSGYPTIREGQQWYQSDHGLFLMHGRPALALTSDQFDALWMEIAHTPLDTPAIVDTARLVDTAAALRQLIESISAADTK